MEFYYLVQDHLHHLVVGEVLDLQSAKDKDPQGAFQGLQVPRSLGLCHQVVFSLPALTTQRVWQTSHPSSANLSSFLHQACLLPHPRPLLYQGFLAP